MYNVHYYVLTVSDEAVTGYIFHFQKCLNKGIRPFFDSRFETLREVFQPLTDGIFQKIDITLIKRPNNTLFLGVIKPCNHREQTQFWTFW